MPFGYSDEIFPYPAVQYIPLQIYQKQTKKNPYSNQGVKINIYKTGDHIFRHEDYTIPQDRLALQVYNGEVEMIKYRGHEVSMVGKKRPGFYHLFQITTSYFYKNKIIFIFYEGKTAQRLARRINST